MRSEPIKTISSTQNAHLKEVVKLKQRKHRDKTQSFLIEGGRELLRANQAGVDLQRLYVCPAYLSTDTEALINQLEPLPWIALQEHVFDKLSYREHPDGLIALAGMRRLELAQLPRPATALWLILTGIEKPGNVGALLRTADAVGVDGIVIVGGTDLYNPNVIRSSVGSCFGQAIASVTDEAMVLDMLKRHHFNIIAASPEASQSYWEASLVQATAIVLGAEDRGLSAAWVDPEVQHVAIPMRGAADSLNVATSGALLLYEALRQRLKGT